jgi:hypothetical protein
MLYGKNPEAIRKKQNTKSRIPKTIRKSRTRKVESLNDQKKQNTKSRIPE